MRIKTKLGEKDTRTRDTWSAAESRLISRNNRFVCVISGVHEVCCAACRISVLWSYQGALPRASDCVRCWRRKHEQERSLPLGTQ